MNEATILASLMRETWRQLMEPVFERAYDKDEWYDVYNKPEQLEMFHDQRC